MGGRFFSIEKSVSNQKSASSTPTTASKAEVTSAPLTLDSVLKPILEAAPQYYEQLKNMIERVHTQYGNGEKALAFLQTLNDDIQTIIKLAKEGGELPAYLFVSDNSTLDAVGDPIILAAAPQYRAPLAIMIARAYIHAAQNQQETAFLQKLHTNQKQIIELVKEGATPSDFFCFGICLWEQNANKFAKKLSTYCDAKKPNSVSRRNIASACDYLKGKTVQLSTDELEKLFNSAPHGFSSLITVLRDPELVTAYHQILNENNLNIIETLNKDGKGEKEIPVIQPISALVAIGKEFNDEFINGTARQSTSGSNDKKDLLRKKYLQIQFEQLQMTSLQSFLVSLKMQIDDPKWNSMGRFGRRAPDGIQQLRDLFSEIKGQEPESVDLDRLFMRVKNILASKQASYFGFGRREDATARFYMEQHKLCQSINPPKPPTPTPVNTHKAS